jgi:hypothetical protein
MEAIELCNDITASAVVVINFIKARYCHKTELLQIRIRLR